MDYKLITEQLSALSEGVTSRVTVLSNASALLYHSLGRLNWCGFYLFDGKDLILGPFQGRTACVKIPLGRGVCGTAAATGKTQNVPDVHKFAGHIACDGASNSELVIPLYVGGALYGVLDIDSPEYCRFSQEDEEGITSFARLLTDIIGKTEKEII
ncbi:MAG: GAF domain-containing protein [Firmicutes bacterium]|nr:GAF domain-containing protein [Candidatus Colimorpha enterica]